MIEMIEMRNEMKHQSLFPYFSENKTMESFIKRFPEQGDRETLAMKIKDHPDVASGTYLVLDNYCTNPACEDNHILLSVLMVEPPIKQPIALLNYSWDAKNPMKFDLQVDDSLEVKAINGPAFRDIMDDHLRTTPSYAKTLQKHYQQFRASLTQNSDAATSNRAQRRARR